MRIPRLDWTALFLDVEGRIGRAAFWLAALCLIGVDVAMSGLGRATAIETDTGVETPALILALTHVLRLAMIWPGLAVAVKRLHDCGHGAGLGLADAVFTLIWLLLDAFGPTRGERGEKGPLDQALSIGATLSLLLTLYLGTRPGQPGPNRFGPPPEPIS